MNGLTGVAVVHCLLYASFIRGALLSLFGLSVLLFHHDDAKGLGL